MKYIPELFASICRLLAVIHILCLKCTLMPAKTAVNGQTAPQAHEQPAPSDLSPREKEIFDLLLDGKAPKTISYDLNIGYETVKFHQKNLYNKLGVQSIQELFTQYKPGYTPPPPKLALFEQWFSFCDKTSTVQMVRKDEAINGKIENVITISGTLGDKGDTLAGTYGHPFSEETLAAMRTMKSFSFKFLGDGNKYCVRLPTFETIEGDHWLHIFETVKDKIMSITINVPDDFIREGWSGKKVDFIQGNITVMQIEAVDRGNYYLKFWDFKFYPPKDKGLNFKSQNNESVIKDWYGNGGFETNSLVSRKKETIDGKEVLAVTISGILNSDNISISGVHGMPYQRTLDIMRTSMKSLSLRFMGDGNRYGISLPTSETMENHNDRYFILRSGIYGEHFMKILHTVPGEISIITINVPNDLIRNNRVFKNTSGGVVEFIQKNIRCIEVHPLDPGEYQFKFWDITLQ